MTDITNLCSNYTADSSTLKNIGTTMKNFFSISTYREFRGFL